MCPLPCRDSQTLITYIAIACSNLQLVLRYSGIADTKQEFTFNTHNGGQHLIELIDTNQCFCCQLIQIIGYIRIRPSYINQVLGYVGYRIDQGSALQYVIHSTGTFQYSDTGLVYRNRQHIHLLTIQLCQILETDCNVI